MLNVVFFINSLYNAGGTERISTLLANKMVSDGYNVSFIVIYNGGVPFFSLSEKIQIHYLNNRGKGSIYLHYLQYLYLYRKMIKRIKPDYIIDVCSAMSLITIPATIGLKVSVISWEHFNANVDWNPITSRLARYMAAKLANKIVVLTNDDKSIFERKYKASNVVCIPNAVTIEVSKPSMLVEKKVLAIGRFTRQKGFDMLLQAWGLVKCKEYGWVLQIVGQGELKDELIEIAQRLKIMDTVTFNEPIQDVRLYYEMSSIYVMSSRFEGLPLVLLEALAMGLPIISFNCETGPKDLVDDGITGVLVEPNNVTQLALEIDSLAMDRERREMYSTNALKKSCDYKMDSIIEKWKKIIK